MSFIPVTGEVAVVAPVIVHVRDAMLLLGSEYVAVRPLDIRTSQLVELVLVTIGAGQLITGGRFSSSTVIVLLVAVTVLLFGAMPVTVAVLLMLPAVISAAVTVCVAVQVVLAPGASVYGAPMQVTTAFGSLTVIPVIVTLPVLVTRKV
jgi:hypothetical protein